MALAYLLMMMLLVVFHGNCVQSKSTNKSQPSTSVLAHVLSQYEFLKDLLLRPELKEALHKLEQLDKQHRDSTCGADITTVLTALASLEPWAIQMVTSFGVPPSNILKGNLWWPGSYSACRNSKQPQHDVMHGEPVQGRYCFVKFQPTEALLKTLHDNHTVEMGMAVCMPKTCSDHQTFDVSRYVVEIASSQVSEQYINVTGVSCLDTYYIPWTAWRIRSRIVFLVILLAFLVLGTFMDMRQQLYINLIRLPRQHVDPEESSPLAKVLISFSVYSNTKRLFDIGRSPGPMQVIKALKVLAMLRIIFVYIYVVIVPMSENVNDITKLMDGFLDKALSQVSLPVDTLLLTNGLEVTYKFLIERTQNSSPRISWSKFFLTRYIRITTPLFFVVWFLYGIFGTTSTSGPLTFARRFEYEACEHNSWQNLLYINNFVCPNVMCASHTWFLAVDMQMLVLISIVLLSLARVETVKAWSITTLGAVASASYAVYMAYLNDAPLTNGLWSGDLSEKRTKPLFTEIDVKPFVHFGVYAVGVACGWMLYNTRCQAQLHKVWVFVAWTAFILVEVVFMVGISEPVNIVCRIIYLTLGRIILAIATAWIIFACASGYGGFVNTILTHRWWTPPSRLTLCAYLLHIPVMLTFLGSNTEVPFYLSHPSVIHLLIGQIVLIYACAMIVAVTIEKPIKLIEKNFLFPRDRVSRPKCR